MPSKLTVEQQRAASENSKVPATAIGLVFVWDTTVEICVLASLSSLDCTKCCLRSVCTDKVLLGLQSMVRSATSNRASNSHDLFGLIRKLQEDDKLQTCQDQLQ